MKRQIPIAIAALLAAACTTTADGPRRSQIRDCPVGMVLICETNRDQEPSRGGEKEIPEYDGCYCEDVM